MESKTVDLQVKLEFSGEVKNRTQVVKNVLDILRRGVDDYGIAPDDDNVTTKSIEVRDPSRNVSVAVGFSSRSYLTLRPM